MAPEPPPLARIWSDLTAAGWRESILRYLSHALLLAVLAGAAWSRRLDLAALDELALKAQVELTVPAPAAQTTPTPLPTASGEVVLAAEAPAADTTSLVRLANLHTVIRTRGRVEVITYTVQKGDTLFGIAEKYSLQPETVVWGNYFTLRDDPHLLQPGQVLNILPVNGAYHYVTEGNTLEQIARFYGVTPEAIADWAGNEVDPLNPVLRPNTWLVVPGGQRESQAWSVPTITRSTRASRTNNFGQCPGGYTGAVGDGVFVWPADNHTLSGYDYTTVHRALDIRAGLGAPIYAVDNGVVVYAGPNDFGYGNLIVLDHGNGWQTVYAHLSQWNVTCGQSIFRGNLIGLAGSTGNSSGPHLHFEMRYNSAYVNPWTVLP